jgi:hypothetical protein
VFDSIVNPCLEHLKYLKLLERLCEQEYSTRKGALEKKTRRGMVKYSKVKSIGTVWWRYIAAQLSIIAKEIWVVGLITCLLGLRWSVGWQCRDCGHDLNVPEFSPAPPRYKSTVCAPESDQTCVVSNALRKYCQCAPLSLTAPFRLANKIYGRNLDLFCVFFLGNRPSYIAS